jgi:predicted nucleic acid-binding protein
MIVVADTSPLNYLLLIDEIDLLPQLFGRVLAPTAVLRELKHAKVDPKVRQWADNLPPWLEVHSVNSASNPTLLALDDGEREAIQLALELHINTVLIDEAEGRHIAGNLHLEVRGTLGILERGASLGKTNLHLALSKLDQTSFRMSPAVRAALLQRNPTSND